MDPAWAPTQAVPTGSSPVADPTGASASAPSGDMPAGMPVAASGPGAPGVSPYAPNYDYAQAPTPYQSQGQPGGAPAAAGWQPIDVGAGRPNAPQGSSKPVTKQWWFWTIIGVVVVALVAGIAIALGGGGDDGDKEAGGDSTSETTKQGGSDSTEGGSDPTADGSDPTGDSTGSSGDVGMSMDNPADPATQSLVIHAGEYDSDPEAYIEVSFGDVNWDATSEVETGSPYTYEEPPSGSAYVRVPVTIVYHGKDKLGSYDVTIDYVKDGSTVSSEYLFADDEFSSQDMPRDGGTATGYFTYIIPTADAHTGVWAVSAFYDSEGEMYMAAK